MPCLRVEGKGDKVRYLPLYVHAQRLITVDGSNNEGNHSVFFGFELLILYKIG